MAFDLPGGWREQLGARLTLHGWRADVLPARSPIMTAARPTSSGLAVVLQLVGYPWPHPGDLRVTVEAGVGVEAAMDLARRLGRSARQGAFFPRDPDLPSPRTVCRGDSVADTCREVVEVAAASFGQWRTRFRDAADLDHDMVVQPRLDRTDGVTERAVILAATGRHQAALSVLDDAIAQLDQSERRDRGWRRAAEQLSDRLRDWIAMGAPPPPPWADQ